MPTVSANFEADKKFICKGKPGVAVAVNTAGCCNNKDTTKKSTSAAAAAATATTRSNVAVYASKCPHVTLIGNIFVEDLKVAKQIELQKIRKRKAKQLLLKPSSKLRKECNNDSTLEESNFLVSCRRRSHSDDEDNDEDLDADAEEEEEEEEEDDNENGDLRTDKCLTCDECEQRKNLWLCLRENCMYIGCGESNSSQHSTNHAHNHHHPLALNLSSRLVWCELCSCKVDLERNFPRYRFKSREIDDNEDDDVDQTRMENSSNNQIDDYDLIEFINQDIDPNREAYEKDTNNLIDSSNSSKLNYEDLPVRNGLIGLDNVGNTCYMNSAVQALSNCIVFTSFFLECSQFIDFYSSNLNNNNNNNCSNSNGHTNDSSKMIMNGLNSSLSNSYMKLMRDIWQKRNKSKRQVVENMSSIRPTELVQTIKYFNTMFRGYMQHDSQEFLIYLLDQLHEELKRPLISFKKSNKPTSSITNKNNRNGSENDDEEEDENSNDNQMDEDEDQTVVMQQQQQQKLNQLENSSQLNGCFNGNKKTKTNSKRKVSRLISNESTCDDKKIMLSNGTEESDSYETCGGEDSAPTSSDVSEKSHFSDVDESPQSPMSIDLNGGASSDLNDDDKSLTNTFDYIESKLNDKSITYSASNITDSGVSTLNSYSNKQISSGNQIRSDSSNSLNHLNTTFNKTVKLNNNEKLSSSSASSASKSTSNSKRQKKKSINNKSAKEVAENEADAKPVYSSIVSELFDGKIIGQVQCLECKHLSTTTETFQHLSLPIPSKEYLQALHSKIVQHEKEKAVRNQTKKSKNVLSSSDEDEEEREEEEDGEEEGNRSSSSSSSSLSSFSASNQTVAYQGWLSWMVDVMKGYIWSPTIKLTECLTAFFSDDDLKGDNMYSCEKCKKLTNGVKYSKVYNLPEILCIHLKRFRHDSMFSTGKINTYVSFPIDNLDMRPFIHKECKNECTIYDLCSFICHHGSANGGHYTAYARNYANEEWYEYDDSHCTQVDVLSVQNAQAYVLFYKKRNARMDEIKQELHDLVLKQARCNEQNSLMPSYYISKQWLHRMKYFSEPGPIDNSDFICQHNLVYPHAWPKIDSLTLKCSYDTWSFLVEKFGVKYSSDNSESDGCEESGPVTECKLLYPCSQCQIDEELLKQRQYNERTMFFKLADKYKAQQLQYLQMHSLSKQNSINKYPILPVKTFAVSMVWFKKWEQFVQSKQRCIKSLIPGKINNLPLCQPQKQAQNNEQPVHVLNKNSNYVKVSEDMWNFLIDIYGGGPELPINAPQSSTSPIQTQKSNNQSCSISSLSISPSSKSISNDD